MNEVEIIEAIKKLEKQLIEGEDTPLPPIGLNEYIEQSKKPIPLRKRTQQEKETDKNNFRKFISKKSR